ncbi:MAG: NUDIX hydrolase, partial [Bacilli bacterium]|nr:NUDIX hydrolase [Bacilli bacterium]
MELIEIVDEKGEFTGEIIDKEEAHDRNLLHNEVATFIINDKSQVLLQKRSPNKRFHPNKWALCAGHVDAYESLEEAAIREIKEEVGLDVDLKDLHSF